MPDRDEVSSRRRSDFLRLALRSGNRARLPGSMSQYDHMLFLNTVVGPGSDGSLLRVEGTDKGLAVSTDGNGGSAISNPGSGLPAWSTRPRSTWRSPGRARWPWSTTSTSATRKTRGDVAVQETVEGMSEACEALGIPVVGGNVSFYNETDGVDIHPTPVVGLLGLADPMPAEPPRLSRAEEDMEIWEVGPPPSSNLAGSSWQRLQGKLHGHPSAPDPATALEVIRLAAELARKARVLHDISDGGLAVALAEICIASGVGAAVDAAHPFSEDPHRFLVVASPGSVELPEEIARRVGVIGGTDVSINGSVLSLDRGADAWHHALERALEADSR
jgi:phosphoribosylformylglycinamidine synthase subunit PurL